MQGQGVVLKATLGVSASELRLPIDSPIASTITLRHLGNSENSIAFKVKTTHAQRYCVRPTNKGLLAPFDSVTLQVFLSKPGWLQLGEIHEMLGENALNVERATLLIQSCTVAAASDDEVDALNENTYLSNPTTECANIRVYHFVKDKDGIDDRARPMAPNLPPFPATKAVRSVLDEVSSNENRCRNIVFGLIGAPVLIWNPLGFFALVMGLNSLLKLVIDRGEWLNELKKFDQNSVNIEGKVLRRKKRDHDIADEQEYSVRLMYKGTDEDGNDRFCTVKLSSDVTVHNARALYEMTDNSSVAHLKILPSYPTSAIPAFLFEEKLKATRFWSRYGHPVRAFLGISIYFGCGFLWLFIYPFYIVLSYTTVGAFFMVPTSLRLVKKELELKRKLLQIEPTSLPTENDSLRWFLNRLGPNPSRRMKLLFSLIGAFLSAVMSPMFGSIILYIFGFVPITYLLVSSRQRKDLQDFKDNALTVDGEVHSRRSRKDQGTTSYYASVRYSSAFRGNTYIIEREFLSEDLFRKLGDKIGVLVHPLHPLSGHPKTLFYIYQNECKYSIGKCLLALAVSTGLYLLGHWLAYDVSLNDPLSTRIINWTFTFIGPILTIPQLSVLGVKQYHKSKTLYFSGAKAVGFRRGCKIHDLAKPNQSGAESNQIESLIAKAMPATLDDESSQTVATEIEESDGDATDDNDCVSCHAVDDYEHDDIQLELV
mmetsp:Transcript_23963/g.50815  ORF Transcript_23963/g.50815 Transcript_23963/m.50815 type:complete len:711 (-) Transcript_23963:184-2316(-)